MAKDIDEDLIEATIRRVAESKAAREAPPIEMPTAESIAPDIEDKGTPAPADSGSAHANDDDDDIEVTPTPMLGAGRVRGITRSVTSLAQAMSTTPDADGFGAGVSREATSLARAMSATPDADEAQPRPARGPVRARPMAALPDPEESPPHVADPDVARQLREINQRLDAITTLLKDLAAAEPPAATGAWGEARANDRASGAAMARPPVFRDAGARPASSDPEPDVIDTRPIPKPLPPLQVEPKRGFDLLPRSYRITVEDKRRGVDLVPLHRALLSMDGVRDMSLLSYNNGVAIVALETTEELNPDVLGASVSRAMSRDARVEVHNEHTMVVKLAEE